jgi:hypothetical protein
MLLDLALGFGEKAEVPTIADRAGKRANGERTRVPEGIEEARATAQLANPLGAPGKMVLFLARRPLERGPSPGIAGAERLSLVQRLRADFSHVIDAHQRRRMRPRWLVQLRLRDAQRRRSARRVRHTAYGAQRTVELRDEAVEACHAASVALSRSQIKTGARRRPYRVVLFLFS